jgi:predicted enzyme related to lactoylglutathione lyase
MNPYSHIDLRVRSFANVTEFYRKLLPELGFTTWWGHEDDDWRGAAAKDSFPSKPFFGFTEDPDHQPNGTRIAFWTDNREDVDRIAEVVQRAGGRNIEGPAVNPEYSEDYYAVFFEDPDGNRLEVVHRTK